MEQMQELTENFCNLVSNNRQEKENDQAIISALRQEISEMKSLISALQKVPWPAPCAPFQPHRTPTTQAAIVGVTDTWWHHTTPAKVAAPINLRKHDKLGWSTIV
jgi:hypothetical protein